MPPRECSFYHSHQAVEMRSIWIRWIQNNKFYQLYIETFTGLFSLLLQLRALYLDNTNTCVLCWYWTVILTHTLRITQLPQCVQGIFICCFFLIYHHNQYQFLFSHEWQWYVLRDNGLRSTIYRLKLVRLICTSYVFYLIINLCIQIII
jgi:hypothetical protein